MDLHKLHYVYIKIKTLMKYMSVDIFYISVVGGMQIKYLPWALYTVGVKCLECVCLEMYLKSTLNFVLCIGILDCTKRIHSDINLRSRLVLDSLS